MKARTIMSVECRSRSSSHQTNNSADATPTINEIPPLSFTSLFRSLVSKDNIILAGLI